jgi:hypothetical protein
MYKHNISRYREQKTDVCPWNMNLITDISQNMNWLSSVHCLAPSNKQKIPWPVVRKRTIPTERLLLVDKVGAIFLRIEGVAWSAQRIPTTVNLDFLDRSHSFLEIAPQLSSRGWVDPVPDPPLLRKSGSARNRTWDLQICSQELWSLDHRGSAWPPLQQTSLVGLHQESSV